jgi:hypothetical protein
MQEEEMLMQTLAKEAEDAIPDDGGIEIDSDDECPSLKNAISVINPD